MRMGRCVFELAMEQIYLLGLSKRYKMAMLPALGNLLRLKRTGCRTYHQFIEKSKYYSTSLYDGSILWVSSDFDLLPKAKKRGQGPETPAWGFQPRLPILVLHVLSFLWYSWFSTADSKVASILCFVKSKGTVQNGFHLPVPESMSYLQIWTS